MTKHLTQRIIDLRRFGLAPQAFTELRLNHTECCFDVRALVIVRQELFMLEVIIVKQARPNRTLVVRRAVRLKGYERRRAVLQSRVKVLPAQIGFICANLCHLEAVLCGLLNKRFEVRAIASVSPTDFNARHDIGLDAAHQMHLDPRMLFHVSTVLGIEPTRELPRSEAGTINREVGFNVFERQTAFRDELFEIRGQHRTFKIAGDAVVVREFGQETATVRFSQITCESSAGERGVNLERHANRLIWRSCTARRRKGQPCIARNWGRDYIDSAMSFGLTNERARRR